MNSRLHRLLYIIILSLLLLIYSCKTHNIVNNNAQKIKINSTAVNNKSFYKEYSIKLGYQLTGNEDMDYIKMVASWIGVPYKFGGCTREGIDCSCFVNTFYNDFFGITLKRRAEDMLSDIHTVDTTKLYMGDLIFFKITGQKVSHVGLYISKRRFIHASTSKGVMINSMDEPYYQKHYQGAGRVL